MDPLGENWMTFKAKYKKNNLSLLPTVKIVYLTSRILPAILWIDYLHKYIIVYISLQCMYGEYPWTDRPFAFTHRMEKYVIQSRLQHSTGKAPMPF